MAFYKAIVIQPNTTLYLWQITESFDMLFAQAQLKNSSLTRLETMKSQSHQKGFLAVRMLLQHIGYSDSDLHYDQNGKPHLYKNHQNEQVEVSISHSHNFSALVISNKKIGLDIEILKEKTLKIAPRFMDVSHLENLEEDEKTKKATVIWGIKEAIFKIKNQEGISFKNHIFEEDFNFSDKKTTAKLKFNNKEEIFKIIFNFVEEYIFVCAIQKN